MKYMRKLFALLLAVMLVMGMATTAFAQTVESGNGGSATITVANASKGETYKVIKLFDASVTGKEDGSIVYTGDVPAALADYFEVVDGYVQAKDAAISNGELSENAISAMKAWAEAQEPVASAIAEGSALTFTGLQYGYYIVTTTQGAAITVDSTNPNATIYDKNSKTPGIVKDVDDDNVYIGQTVTYTATSTTSNYLGEGASAQKVVRYEISDTLPDFLTDVTVTSIVIDQDADANTTGDQIPLDVQQFDESKKITIAWVDENGNSLYKNGSLIIITYTAKVTDKAAVDGEGNKNVVTLQPYVDTEEGPKPWEESWKDDAIIYTYAVALKKVDENKAPLAGAKFAANGLEVTGSKGYYTVVSYNPDSTTPGTVMETDDEGKLVIIGLPSDVTLVVSETEAPAGYNKLTETFELTPIVIGETVTVSSTTIYYDSEGKVVEEVTETSTTTIKYNTKLEEKAIEVENMKGTELPSTGGIGTTMFYIIGGTLVLAAVILLVTKKRMAE